MVHFHNNSIKYHHHSLLGVKERARWGDISVRKKDARSQNNIERDWRKKKLNSSLRRKLSFQMALIWVLINVNWQCVMTCVWVVGFLFKPNSIIRSTEKTWQTSGPKIDPVQLFSHRHTSVWQYQVRVNQRLNQLHHIHGYLVDMTTVLIARKENCLIVRTSTSR